MSSITLQDRYVVSRRVGEGASGFVHEAEDRELARRVALKMLRSPDPGELLRLKKEFRVLVDLNHPNLIELHDLVITPERAFFTMEFVEGSQLHQWVRGGESAQPLSSKAQLARLASGLVQLARGLGTLHAHGMLHRDIKPSNIMVNGEGRIILLDMGLATRFEADESKASHRTTLAGTFCYMAPEQAAGQLLSPRADWYSVGVVLHEILTGRLPASTRYRLLGADAPTVPDILELAPAAPRALCELTASLLSPCAEDRPDPSSLLSRLEAIFAEMGGVELPSWDATGMHIAECVIGRGRELERLLAWTGTTELSIVHVHGRSGIGKSALIREFLGRISDSRTVILQTRCHHREYLPFKAVDGLIDGLSRYLSHLSSDEVADFLVPGIEPLADTFPSMARVLEAVSGERQLLQVPGDDPSVLGEISDRLRQQQAFKALRDVLARLSDRRRVVAWIDDLQWGDLDSIRLLRALFREPSPPQVTLVLSYRPEAETSPALRALLEAEDLPRHDELSLHALSRSDSERALRALVPHDSGLSNEQFRAIATASRGHPLMLRELARALVTGDVSSSIDMSRGVDLNYILLRRLRQLPRAASEILRFLGAAGRPLPEPVFAHPALAIDEPSEGLRALRREGLLRTASAPEGVLFDVFHEQLRDAVLSESRGEQLEDLHARLARAIEELPDEKPELLIDHLVLSGEPEKAAERALLAAGRAEERFAFEQSASLYRRALMLNAQSRPTWEIQLSMARASMSAGRSADGARDLTLAAKTLSRQAPGDPRVVDLQTEAAGQLVRSGYAKEGLAMLDSALIQARQPFSKRRFISLMWGLANWPRMARARDWFLSKGRHQPQRRDPSVDSLLNTLWLAGQAIAGFDSLRGPEFQVRHALLAYRIRNHAHIARSLGAEALLLAMSANARKQKLWQSKLTEARILSETSEDQAAHAFVLMSKSFCNYFAGRWEDAARAASRAITYCHRVPENVAWELANAWIFQTASLVQQGRLAEAKVCWQSYLEEAAAHDNNYAVVNLTIGHPALLYLADDEPLSALHASRRAEDFLPRERFLLQHYLALFSAASAELYQGDTTSAIDRIRASWSRLRLTFFLQFPQSRVDMRHLLGRCYLASLSVRATLCPGSLETKEARAALRFVDKLIRQLKGDKPVCSEPMAELLAASKHAVSGQTDEAIERLRRAASDFEHRDMAVWNAATRYALAVLTDSVQDRREALTYLQLQGVREPEKFARLFVPGLPPAEGPCLMGPSSTLSPPRS